MVRELFRPLGSRLLRDARDTRIGDLGECPWSAIAGVPWDWNTGGDPGARHAPRQIIERLLSLPDHRPGLDGIGCKPRILGDIAVSGGDWATTRERLRRAASRVFDEYTFSLFVGGDHSITGPILEALLEKGSVGLLMLDAHYDLRSVEEGVTSGSWLWDTAMIARKRLDARLEAAIIGVADFANPAYLEERARRLGFRVVPARGVSRSGIEAALEAVDWLASQAVERYYVTIDMDHVAEAYAPGVNSPSPLGLHPSASLEIVEYAMEKLRPIGADIVEVVPIKDVRGRTVRLASMIGATLLWGAKRWR
ncbi:MAG: arginase family protein [Desulfurococcales archaeon]|nr:arginase family protein [Desulfurococcales archaeon]